MKQFKYFMMAFALMLSMSSCSAIAQTYRTDCEITFYSTLNNIEVVYVGSNPYYRTYYYGQPRLAIVPSHELCYIHRRTPVRPTPPPIMVRPRPVYREGSIRVHQPPYTQPRQKYTGIPIDRNRRHNPSTDHRRR